MSRMRDRIRSKLINSSDSFSPYRAVEVLDQLKSRPDESIKTLSDIPDYCFERFAQKETLCVRQILDVQQEEQQNGKIFQKFVLGDYHFMSYAETYEHIVSIGKGLLSIGIQQNQKILIFSETRSEWLLTAFAAFRHGIIVVTLYSTLGEEAIKHGINESEVSLVVTSNDLLNKLEKVLPHTEKVRHVIYFPSLCRSQSVRVPQNNPKVQFISLQNLQESGKTTSIDEGILRQRPSASDIAVIMYTSGSTGTPKGVLLRHENVIAAMTGEGERVFPLIDTDNDVYIAYLPLAHILELSCEILVYFLGVKLGYSSPQTLTDQSTSIKRGQKGDLQILRPHIMCCVPTILDRIYKTVNEKISELSFFRRQLFKVSYKIKVQGLEKGADTPMLNRLVFQKLNQTVLGGRVKTMLCGGAVLSGDTQRFVQAALCVTLFQGYGLTETSAAGTIADQFDTSVGRVGYPLVSCEIRLRDWDEGQYRNIDKPNPRGEILIGGKVVADGYFAQASSENTNFIQIDQTKYFCTGDIGEIFPNGTLKIIDRKKDLVKLRTGEYVSLAKVELAISKLPFVEQCCLYASPSADFTILLISPNSKQMSIYTEKKFGEKDWQLLLNNDQFNEQILKDVQDSCRKGGIEKFETPQNVSIVNESWIPETGLVTDAFKLKRKAIQSFYQSTIEQLYQPKQIKQKQKIRKSQIAPIN